MIPASMQGRRLSGAGIMPLAATLLLASIAFAAAGCGGSEDVATEVVTDSIVDPEDLPETVIDDDDLDEYDEGSVERAFLEYWTALQYGDVAVALEFYDPALLGAVGPGVVADGLRFGSSLYRSRKPGIVETAAAGEEIETVRYLLQDLSGTRAPYSVSWRQLDGEWKIVFNSYLGESIAAAVQAREQARIDPAAQTFSPEAEREGNRIAARQQDFYNEVLAGS